MTAGATSAADPPRRSVQQSSTRWLSLGSEGAELGVRVPAASAPQISAPHEPSIASVGDYLALMKPRVMSLVVFTALVGLMIAPGHIHPVIGFAALLCLAG